MLKDIEQKPEKENGKKNKLTGIVLGMIGVATAVTATIIRV